jgi:hypothetical protein
MSKKRTRFKVGTLEISTNPTKNILAKRLVMSVRYVSNFPNQKVLSMTPTGIK